MKRFFIILLLLVALLVGFVIFAPALLLPFAIVELENRGLLAPDAPQLQLEQLSGTVWSGQAGSTVLVVDGQAVELGRLKWKVNVQSLLARQPAIFVQTNGADQRIQGDFQLHQNGEIAANNIEGRLPVSVLEPWLPMIISGDVAFVIDHMVMTPARITQLDGLINLEYVEWLGGDRNMRLGSYTAQLLLNSRKDIEVLVNDFGAALGVTGLITVRQSGSYNLDLTLMPRADLAPEVAEAVNWMGRADGNGNVLLRRNGAF